MTERQQKAYNQLSALIEAAYEAGIADPGDDYTGSLQVLVEQPKSCYDQFVELMARGINGHVFQQEEAMVIPAGPMPGKLTHLAKMPEPKTQIEISLDTQPEKRKRHGSRKESVRRYMVTLSKMPIILTLKQFTAEYNALFDHLDQINMNVLVNRDLVKKIGYGTYQITERGRRAMAELNRG